MFLICSEGCINLKKIHKGQKQTKESKGQTQTKELRQRGATVNTEAANRQKRLKVTFKRRPVMYTICVICNIWLCDFNISLFNKKYLLFNHTDENKIGALGGPWGPMGPNSFLGVKEI